MTAKPPVPPVRFVRPPGSSNFQTWPLPTLSTTVQPPGAARGVEGLELTVGAVGVARRGRADAGVDRHRDVLRLVAGADHDLLGDGLVARVLRLDLERVRRVRRHAEAVPAVAGVV